MKNEITVLHAEQIAPSPNTNIQSAMQTKNDFHGYLQCFLGCHCTCIFACGNGQSHTLEGVLQDVGKNCFLLYNKDTDTTSLCSGATLQYITCRRSNFHP